MQIHSSLKVATQVDKVVKKAYGMLAFIGQGVEYSNWKIMLQLCKTFVRILPEDVDVLERVQKRFTRMLPGLVDMDYEERLKKLGLFSLECRRMTGT